METDNLVQPDTREAAQKKQKEYVYLASAALGFLIIATFIGHRVIDHFLGRKVEAMAQTFATVFEVPSAVTTEIDQSTGPDIHSLGSYLSLVFWQLLAPLALPALGLWAAREKDKNLLNGFSTVSACCGVCSGLACCFIFIFLIGFGSIFAAASAYLEKCDIEAACPSSGTGDEVTDCILASTFYTKYERMHPDFGEPFTQNQTCVSIFLNCTVDPNHNTAQAPPPTLRLYEQPGPSSTGATQSAVRSGLEMHRHLQSLVSHPYAASALATTLGLPAPASKLLATASTPSFSRPPRAANGQASPGMEMLPAVRAGNMEATARRLNETQLHGDDALVAQNDRQHHGDDALVVQNAPFQLWRPELFDQLDNPMSQCESNPTLIEMWAALPEILSELEPVIQATFIFQIIMAGLGCIALAAAARASNELSKLQPLRNRTAMM